MIIDDKTIEYASGLSKLELDASEKDGRKADLKEVLDYIDKLNELDTEGVLEMSKPFSNVNGTREDVQKKEFDKELFLKNAPQRKNDYFKVTKIMGE